MSHSDLLPHPTLANNQHNEKEENDEEEEEEKPLSQLLHHLRHYISTICPTSGCSFNPLYLHNNCYIPENALLPSLLVPHLFRPKPSDVLLATLPKSGTTWLKALLFATFHRHAIPYDHPQHPLLHTTPHECVPFLEFRVFATNHLQSIPGHQHDHQLLATHLPFHLLPNPLNCRIIYLCRDPKDNFVSLWQFVNRLRSQIGQHSLSLEEAFEGFCNGRSLMGPYWDHMIGYWKMQEIVLFLRYEEMMEDPIRGLKRVAEFIGRPFTTIEEEEGMLEGIVRVCGFQRLRGLEVNRRGVSKTAIGVLENSMYFREGKVGDWVNHFSPEMGRRLDEITASKLEGTGLSFEGFDEGLIDGGNSL